MSELELIKQIARLQRQVDGLIKPEVPTGLFNPATSLWQTWTLVITQGVDVTHSPTFVRYFRLGDLVVAAARTTVSSSGTGGQHILITGMPARVSAHETSTSAVGVGVVRVVTALTYHECTVIFGTTGLAFVDGSSNNFLGANPSVQLVSGWTIGFTIAYEAE